MCMCFPPGRRTENGWRVARRGRPESHARARGNERANVRRAGECAAAHDQHGRVVMAHGRACWLTWACKRMETE